MVYFSLEDSVRRTAPDAMCHNAEAYLVLENSQDIVQSGILLNRFSLPCPETPMQ